MNAQNQGQDPQIIVTGRIEPNQIGGEVIKFAVNLGLFQLKVIATVPCEGDTEAPVYIKFRLKNTNVDKGSTLVEKARNPRPKRPSNHFGLKSAVGYDQA